MPILARRYEHWLGPVSPLPGPAGKLWLRPWGIPRRIALDPDTGARVVDEQGDLAPPKTPSGAGFEITRLPSHEAGAICHILVRLPEADRVIEVAVQSVRGADAVLTETHLAIYEHADVLWIERAALVGAGASRVELTVEDVATDPPPPTELATVDYIGATTGMGFLETERFGRVRFDGRGAPLKKGDDVVAELGPDGKLSRWRLPNASRQPLPSVMRCLSPASWDMVEQAHALAEQQAEAAAQEARATKAEQEKRRAQYLAQQARAQAKASEAERARATHRTSVVFDVEVETRDGEILEDEDALRELDGLRESSEDLLFLLADDEKYDGVWLRGVVGVLRFDRATDELTFNIEFYAEEAADAEANRYLGEVANRLMTEHYAKGLSFQFKVGMDHGGTKIRAQAPWREIETTKLAR